jgi:hypothetical protein
MFTTLSVGACLRALDAQTRAALFFFFFSICTPVRIM